MNDRELVKSFAPINRALTIATKSGQDEEAEQIARELFEAEQSAYYRAHNRALFCRLVREQDKAIWKEVHAGQ